MALLAQKGLLNSEKKENLPNKEESKYCNVCFAVMHCTASNIYHIDNEPSILHCIRKSRAMTFCIFVLNRQSPCPSTLIEYQYPSHE